PTPCRTSLPLSLHDALPICSGLKAWAELSARPDAPEPPSFPPNMGVPDEQITTIVDVRPFVEGKLSAFKAHTSQNGPEAFFLSTDRKSTRLNSSHGSTSYAV